MQGSSLEDVFIKSGQETQKSQASNEYIQSPTIYELSRSDNKHINDYRHQRRYLATFCDQVASSLRRKWLFFSRNLKETVFEMMVPVVLIFIGLSLTHLHFAEERPTRLLVP